MMAVGNQSTQGRDRFLLILRHYAKEVPITRPRPNVIPAASTPKRTWRTPEYSTPRPVSSEMPAPTPNSATRLPPHLLLVSLGGPPAEVLTTAVRIRHRAHLRPAVPIVIFCTPTVAEGAEVELAGQVYLTRPDNFDQLRALLQRLLCPTPGRGDRRA